MTYLQLRYFNTDTKRHMLHSEKSIKSLLLIKLLFQKIILQKSYRKRADFKVVHVLRTWIVTVTKQCLSVCHGSVLYR